MKKLMIVLFAVLIAGYAGAQTKTAIKAADLNKAITEHITKNYAGQKITNAFKVETNKVVTYEVTIQKEAAKTVLVYNDKFEFVKAKVPQTAKPKAVKATTTPKSTSTKTK
jgi:hypothetical protein